MQQRPTSCFRALGTLLAILGLARQVAVAEQTRPVAPAVPMPARPLPRDAVRLIRGPLKNAQGLDAAYLLQLEPDRMLVFLRSRAGLT